ncbi:DinB family protein [Roseofilum casamattae]|uniref:DinB family protein n=1 Tax=Roseofilum casamattae BLCC-M143 TaxID=3022442 RepID=A0ABT7C1U4_9CYAN|nr:DinB family protein [Roseofilum casamattae]MDJ1185430.1 DinB family protein [Roseofilum casamattae BLCC-M143]
MRDELVHHFQQLARYNTLANRRLYNACEQLTEAELKQIRPAFFRSIYGTLNHIMVGDRIWLTRFAGGTIPSTGLDAILYDDFVQLWDARQAEDKCIEKFAADLTSEFLRETIRYTNNAGNVHQDPTVILVAHFFNHQTHHRGQVHGLLSQTLVPPPSLDMHRLLLPHPQETGV